MTQTSYFWDGKTVGDAANAPYSSSEFTKDFLSKFMFNLVSGYGYVISSTGTALGVVADSPVSMNVLVAQGNMWCGGRLYVSDATETLALAAADPANPRIDRIVVRESKDSTVQTIRLVVLTGTPAASPTKPTLTNSATITEYPLAYIWVAAAAASIADTEIHDERVFLTNFETIRQYIGQDNLISNSEFIAFSARTTVPAAIPSPQPPDFWDRVATPSAISALAASTTGSYRGNTIRITADAVNEGVSQTTQCKPTTAYTAKVLISATAGDVGVITLVTNGASPVTVTRYRRFTGWEEERITLLTPSDATTITLQVLCLNNTDVIDMGHSILIEGLEPGAYRQFHETIPLRYSIGDSSWNATAKSTSGPTTLSVVTNFQTLFGVNEIRGVWLYIEARDSGSGAGTASLTISSSGTVNPLAVLTLDGVPNDEYRSMVCLVGLSGSNSPTFSVDVVATGALTLDATIRIVGIVT